MTSSDQNPADTRRAPRRSVAELVPVTDLMSGQVVGRLGNISETGMLLLASMPLREDALYQLQFPLPMAGGVQQVIDIGAHLLWREAAHVPGQAWSGFRFLTVSRAHRHALRAWIEQDTSAE